MKTRHFWNKALLAGERPVQPELVPSLDTWRAAKTAVVQMGDHFPVSSSAISAILTAAFFKRSFLSPSSSWKPPAANGDSSAPNSQVSYLRGWGEDEQSNQLVRCYLQAEDNAQRLLGFVWEVLLVNAQFRVPSWTDGFLSYRTAQLGREWPNHTYSRNLEFGILSILIHGKKDPFQFQIFSRKK